MINRDRWGFTPEERMVLVMLTPHLAQAWKNRLILEQPHVPAHDKNGDGVSTACYQLVVDHFGNLINGPPLAILWLREHFEDTSKFGGALFPLVVRQLIMKALAQLVKKSLPIAAADLSVEHTDFKGDRWCFTLIPGRRDETHRIIGR